MYKTFCYIVFRMELYYLTSIESEDTQDTINLWREQDCSKPKYIYMLKYLVEKRGITSKLYWITAPDWSLWRLQTEIVCWLDRAVKEAFCWAMKLKEGLPWTMNVL